MKKLVCALALAGFVSTAYAQPFGDEFIRFFFDTKGVDLATDPRGVADPLSFTNPVQNNAAGVDGGERFYIYVQYGTANQQFNGINLVVNTTLGARIRQGAFFNKPGLPGGTRWTTGASFGPGDTGSWVIGSIVRGLPSGYGARNNDVNFATTMANDNHFKSDDGSTNGTTLLGWVDVDHTGSFGDPDGQIRLASGTSGHAGVTITNGDTVYYGFGDAGTSNKASRTSVDADAFVHVVPEPATLALLGLGALALRRRR